MVNDWEDLDFKIAANKAETGVTTGNTDFDQYVKALHDSRQHQELASAYLQRAQQAEEYVTYLLTAGGQTHTEEAPNPQVQELFLYAQEMCKKAKKTYYIFDVMPPSQVKRLSDYRSATTVLFFPPIGN